MAPTSVPVASLTVLGIVIAVLGLFVAGNMATVAVGLLAVFAAGVLQAAGGRG